MPFFDLPQSQLESYRSNAKAPDDFDGFWSTTLSEARSVALDPVFERVDVLNEPRHSIARRYRPHVMSGQDVVE